MHQLCRTAGSPTVHLVGGWGQAGVLQHLDAEHHQLCALHRARCNHSGGSGLGRQRLVRQQQGCGADAAAAQLGAGAGGSRLCQASPWMWTQTSITGITAQFQCMNEFCNQGDAEGAKTCQAGWQRHALSRGGLAAAPAGVCGARLQQLRALPSHGRRQRRRVGGR